MKQHFTTTVLAVVTLAGSVLANDEIKQQRREGARSDEYREHSSRADADRLNHPMKASDVIGSSVRNPANEKLGSISDLIVDVDSGRILEVVVSVGGFLGVGDRHVAVPPQAFTEKDKNDVCLDADQAKLKGAPEVSLSKWESNWDTNRLERVYSYYGQEPIYMDRPSLVRKAEREAAIQHHVARASKLVGQSIDDRQGDKLGKIDDLIVDLTAGRVVFAVISTGGFLGLGDELSAVPLTVLRHKEGKENPSTVYFDATKDRLSQAPHFKKSQWPQWDEEYTTRVYRAQDVEPYFTTRPTGRDAEPDRRDALTPMEQGKSPADMDTTRTIRQQIEAEKGFSVEARNVKVITIDGRVTIRGAVTTQEEKRKIADIVRRNVKNGEVDNQLEIKAQSK